jgi:hypothetical protein
MTTTRTTHQDRETAAMADLQASFPGVADDYLWAKVGRWVSPDTFLESTTLSIAPTIASGGQIEVNIPPEDFLRGGVDIEFHSLQGRPCGCG